MVTCSTILLHFKNQLGPHKPLRFIDLAPKPTPIAVWGGAVYGFCGLWRSLTTTISITSRVLFSIASKALLYLSYFKSLNRLGGID